VENDEEDVDDDFSFQMELRKQNCLVPIDRRLLRVAIPEFDEKKANLKVKYWNSVMKIIKIWI